MKLRAALIRSHIENFRIGLYINYVRWRWLHKMVANGREEEEHRDRERDTHQKRHERLTSIIVYYYLWWLVKKIALNFESTQRESESDREQERERERAREIVQFKNFVEWFISLGKAYNLINERVLVLVANGNGAFVSIFNILDINKSVS